MTTLEKDSVISDNRGNENILVKTTCANMCSHRRTFLVVVNIFVVVLVKWIVPVNR